MIILDNINKTLQVNLVAPVVTNQFQFVTSYADILTSGYTTYGFISGEQDGLTNNTSNVTVLNSPALNFQRQLKFLSVYNADTAANSINLFLYSGSTSREIGIFTLPSGSTLVYNQESGFEILPVSSVTNVYNTINLPGSTSASNGLGLSGSNITLGGPLTATTTIGTTGNNYLIVNNLSASSISGTVIYDNHSNLTIDTDNRFLVGQDGTTDILSWGNTGVTVYGGFSANTISGNTYYSGTTPLWNIIFGTVTGNTSSPITASNGLTKSNNNITLGGSLTGITTISTNPYYLIIPSLSANSITASSIYDLSTAISISPNNRLLYYNGGSPVSIDYGSSLLYDPFGRISVAYDSRTLFDQSVVQSVGWNSRHLFDNSGIISVDWKNRLLVDSGGTNTLSWNPTGITVFGGVYIEGDVQILGTATTIFTQTLSTEANYISLNLSGSHLSSLYGGLYILSGQPSGNASSWTIDSNGNWSANTQIIAGNGINSLGSIQSGGTDLYSIFSTQGGEVILVGANGNLFTGGTNTYPTINIAASPIFNNITISGTGFYNALSATTFSAGTINSGSTNLYQIFQGSGIGVQSVGSTGNITTGGTFTNPTIGLTASPSINGLTVSGTGNFNIASATTLSASTYISGSTNLYQIFQGSGIGVQSVGSTGNIITGGTFTNPTIGLIDSPSINGLTVSGTGNFNAVSATTLSASTINSGTTSLWNIIFSTVTGNTSSGVLGVEPGSNITTGGTSQNPFVNLATNISVSNITGSGTSLINAFSATTVSGGTYYSGTTSLWSIIYNAVTGTSQPYVQSVAATGNIITGGTFSNPIISEVASPSFNNINASGLTTSTSITGSSISGGSITFVDNSAFTAATSSFVMASFNQQGFSVPHAYDNLGDAIELTRDNIFIARNTTASSIAKGSAIYFSGATGTVPTLNLACASATTTLGSIGIMYDTTATNAFGRVMMLGLVEKLNLSAFNNGDPIYVSSTPGSLTNVSPTYPNYSQLVGYVVNNGNGNGVLQVYTRGVVQGVQSVIPGSNITTGGTFVNPSINLAASPSINGLTVSGTGNFNAVSATTLSASTINSGTTNLYNIFMQGSGPGVSNIIPGTNIQTGGTQASPIISTISNPIFSALTVSGFTLINDSFTVTGTTTLNTLTANTISATTLVLSSLNNNNSDTYLLTLNSSTNVVEYANASAVTTNYNYGLTFAMANNYEMI